MHKPMNANQQKTLSNRSSRRHLMVAASFAVAAFATPARAQDAGKGLTAPQLLKRSLDTFLAKDMKGWADLCDEKVVVEFPFSPDPATRKLVGRSAIYAYLKDYPKAIDVKSIPALKIHATDDPNVAIAGGAHPAA